MSRDYTEAEGDIIPRPPKPPTLLGYQESLIAHFETELEAGDVRALAARLDLMAGAASALAVRPSSDAGGMGMEGILSQVLESLTALAVASGTDLEALARISLDRTARWTPKPRPRGAELSVLDVFSSQPSRPFTSMED